MDGLQLILIVLGIVAAIGVYLWLRQYLHEQRERKVMQREVDAAVAAGEHDDFGVGPVRVRNADPASRDVLMEPPQPPAPVAPPEPARSPAPASAPVAMPDERTEGDEFADLQGLRGGAAVSRQSLDDLDLEDVVPERLSLGGDEDDDDDLIPVLARGIRPATPTTKPTRPVVAPGSPRPSAPLQPVAEPVAEQLAPEPEPLPEVESVYDEPQPVDVPEPPVAEQPESEPVVEPEPLPVAEQPAARYAEPDYVEQSQAPYAEPEGDAVELEQPVSLHDEAYDEPERAASTQQHSVYAELEPPVLAPAPVGMVAPEDELVVALSVFAGRGQGFTGEAVLEALAREGARFGEMDIFHVPVDRNDPFSSSLFSIASAVEPGTLVPDEMVDWVSPGLVLFMRLPGVLEGLAAFDRMYTCGSRIAESLGGRLCDERRSTLTKQTVNHLKERIAAHEALLRKTRRR